MTTERIYPSQIKIVSEYLNDVTLSTIMDLKENTGITHQQYRRMVKDKTLTTSLNYEHNWVTLTSIIRKNKDHWGFFTHRIERYSRTVAIFHIKRTGKDTLPYLASKRPWGLSEKEAEELLGRDCKRTLRELENNNSIQSRIIHGDRVYLNRVNKKADVQVKERRINPKFHTDDNE